MPGHRDLNPRALPQGKNQTCPTLPLCFLKKSPGRFNPDGKVDAQQVAPMQRTTQTRKNKEEKN
jgi:hypothetical protein